MFTALSDFPQALTPIVFTSLSDFPQAQTPTVFTALSDFPQAQTIRPKGMLLCRSSNYPVRRVSKLGSKIDVKPS